MIISLDSEGVQNKNTHDISSGCARSLSTKEKEKSFMATVDSQSSAFLVLSWNVLHIVHELNHVWDNSPVLVQYSIREDFSNEKKRLDDIVKTLHQLLSNYSTMECFVCLQEVPGDLIPMLGEMLASLNNPTASIHVQTYPRRPQFRRQKNASIYTDVNESLVTIHLGGKDKADQVSWTQCPNDPGKGALTVTTTSGLKVVNIHLPFDNRAALSLLNAMSWPEANIPFVLVGDMNRSSSSLMRIIQPGLKGRSSSSPLIPIVTDKPSQVGLNQNGSRSTSFIDHYLVSPALASSTNASASVFDQIGDLSDHYPILFSFPNH
jgi:endonuclease/exonuclease/phosphatase family metal-dependent hydrolase